MKIALVHPPYRQEEVYGKFHKSAPILPPLGLAYIASYLEKFGIEVSIFDCPAEGMNILELVDNLIKFKPDIIGIMANSILVSRAIRITELIKTFKPEIKTVLGGYHPTFFPEDILKRASVDYVVIGEGEETLLELSDNIRRKGDFSRIKGLGYKSKGIININAPRYFIKNLDDLPFPAYHLLPIDKYRLCPTSSRSQRQVSVISSRGCLFNCYFCASPGFWKKNRCHSPEYVIKMLNYLYENYKIDEIQFKDDIFTIDRDRLLRICNLLKKNKKKFAWSCYSTFHTLDKSLMKEMKEAGCYQLHIGVESGSDYILRRYKGVSKELIYKVVDDAKKIGMELRLFFMFGPPNQTERDINETIKFAIELEPDSILALPSIPYPGSQFYFDLVKNGYRVPDFNKQIFSNDMPICDIPSFDRELLQKKIKELYIKFYLRPKYLLKKIRYAIKSLNNLKKNFTGFFSLINFIRK